MKKNSLADKASGIGDDLVIKERPEKGQPRTAGGMMLALREVIGNDKEELDQLKEKLRLAEQGQGTKKFPISRLHKIPGRQRKLSIEEYGELRENLRHNALDTPITVTLREDGDWDIVSGHNRTDIYAELGLLEIEGVEKSYSFEEASRLSFYSNLLHPSLTDYAKYLGFKQRMAETDKDQAALSAESGLSKDIISRLMSFDRLPEEARAIMHDNQLMKLGAKAAATLAMLAENGKTKQVVEAIRAIAEQGINQDAALDLASKNEKQSIPKEKKPESNKIKHGKTIFAEVVGVGKNIRIALANEEYRSELELEIDATIRKFIAQRADKI